MTWSTLASAETILLIMDAGPAKEELFQRIATQLEGAGLKVQRASATLEDSILMLGCDADEDACLDMVAKAGGADSILVLPSEGGSVIGRRQQERRTAPAPESADDEAGWRLALQGALEIDFAGTTAATDPEGEMGETSSAQSSEDGGEGTKSGDDLGEGTPSNSTTAASTEVQASAASAGPIKKRSWVVLGSGAALGGLGLLFASIASSKQDKVNAHPIDTAADLDALADLESSGANFTLAANLSLVGGGLAVLAGVGLVVWDRKSSSEQHALTIAPSVASESVGLTLSWSSP